MFTKSTYLVRERVGLLKLVDTYDIFEADTGTQVAIAQEKPGAFILFLRFLINKQMLPTTVNIAPQADAAPIIVIHRKFSFLRSKVSVKAGDGRELGYFKSKILSLGGGFLVFNKADQQIAEIKGNWKGWDFKFLTTAGAEIGTVTKQWAGIAKELFTSADNYVINLAAGQPQEAVLLLIAAGIAIDTIYKEN